MRPLSSHSQDIVDHSQAQSISLNATKKKQDIVDYSKAQNISLTGYTTLGGVLNKGTSLSTETVKELAGKHSQTKTSSAS